MGIHHLWASYWGKRSLLRYCYIVASNFVLFFSCVFIYPGHSLGGALSKLQSTKECFIATGQHFLIHTSLSLSLSLSLARSLSRAQHISPLLILL